MLNTLTAMGWIFRAIEHSKHLVKLTDSLCPSSHALGMNIIVRCFIVLLFLLLGRRMNQNEEGDTHQQPKPLAFWQHFCTLMRQLDERDKWAGALREP